MLTALILFAPGSCFAAAPVAQQHSWFFAPFIVALSVHQVIRLSAIQAGSTAWYVNNVDGALWQGGFKASTPIHPARILDSPRVYRFGSVFP
jgi:hypothetical protein